MLDRTLSLRPQVDLVTKKVNKVLYTLRFIRLYTTLLLRQRLIQALIFLQLDYCDIIKMNATNELKRRLQKLQNTCIRYIFGVRRRVHITPYRQRLGWMRSGTRRTYFTAVLLYKVLNFRSPSYLFGMFSKRLSDRPARSVTGELKIPRVNSEYGSGSFHSQGIKL